MASGFDKDEFERQWQSQMERESRFVRDFAEGRFADGLQGEDARGCPLDRLIDRSGQSVMHDELGRLSTAVIAWRAARDLGDALRHVEGDCYLATGNVGFEFESDTFRLASYDWSEDEDEDGNHIVRHNFEYKPAGNYLDWYKWAGRDDWASCGLVAAFEEAEELNIPLYAWWGEVINACIQSLIVTDEAKFRRIDSCGWRHFDEGSIPKGIIRVNGEIRSPEVDAVEFSHPEEGYVGFKVDPKRGSDMPEGATDVTDRHAAIATMLEEAVEESARRPLDQEISVRAECPDDVGYVLIGDMVFRRMVLNGPPLRLMADDD